MIGKVVRIGFHLMERGFFFRDHNRFFSINIEKEKIEWSMFYADDASILGFVSNGDKFVIRYYDKGEFRFFLVDSATGKILSNYSGETQNLYKSISSNSASEKNYSPDGKYFFIHEFGQISVKEVSTDKQVCFIDNVDIFDDCIFLRENPYIAVEKDTSIEFWNYYTGKLEYTTILCNKTGIWNYEIDKNNLLDTFFVENWGANYHLVRTDYDYLTYTPEGFFTGTEWAMKNLVHIVDGMDVIGIDQVYDKLYRPDLVAAKMRGEDVSEYAKEVNLASIVRSGNAPAVAIENLPELSDSRDVSFDICVQNTGGGIGNVSIVLNGKIIRLSEGVASSKGEQKIFRHTVTLQNGQNKIEAFAMNSAGMIESRRASADLSWQGKTSKPNLYVLTVAVNKYRDKDLWLNYCVPDATSIEESFKNSALEVLEPVAKVLDNLIWPITIIAFIAGAIWLIWLGVKLAKAEDESKQKEAKKALINVAIALVSVLVLFWLLVWFASSISGWVKDDNPFSSNAGAFRYYLSQF